MYRSHWIRPLFSVAVVYDGILGLTLLFAGKWLWEHTRLTPSNDVGFLQFTALVLLIFAFMFLAVARRPVAKRDLIPYGMAMKTASAGVVLFHWLGKGIPDLWLPLAVINVGFLLLFGFAYLRLRDVG